MRDLLVEGAPFSYGVVVVGLIAILASVVQLTVRKRDLSPLVFGMLAALLVLEGAGIGYGLTFLRDLNGADAATKAISVARAGSTSIGIVYIAGVIGAVASILAIVGSVVMPHRRAEGTLRGAVLLGVFVVLAVFASSLRDAIGEIVMAEPEAKGTLVLMALGRAGAMMSMGLGVCFLLAFAGAIGASLRSRSATA